MDALGGFLLCYSPPLRHRLPGFAPMRVARK